MTASVAYHKGAIKVLWPQFWGTQAVVPPDSKSKGAQVFISNSFLSPEKP